MNLKCLGSSSKGNCYILQGASSRILLEAGIEIKNVRNALDFKIDVVGCLVTHEHKDHIASVSKMLLSGIPVYGTKGTLEGIQGHNINYIEAKKPFELGEFKIMPFESIHDTREPMNFLVESLETKERLLFITDTAFCKYKFKKIDYLLIEANHTNELLIQNYPPFLVNRIRENHMELQTTIDFIGENEYKSIVLLHLSEKNSDPLVFRNEVLKNTQCKKVFVAQEGLDITL